ncbi:hypothetical protein CKO51_25650 [Rhodopirellula sp. SM50]|nr:hypothetical protein CKO51_25650 [Rhodopirellula sp. SM50]
MIENYSSFSPDPVEHTANLSHLFSDYAELLALLANGDEFSRADLVKRFESFDLKVPEISAEFAGPAFDHERSAAEEDDAFDNWSLQVYQHLEWRQHLLSDDYPFQVADGSIQLASNLSERQELYLMLLLCSNLAYFKKVMPILTSDFEQVAFESFRNYMPKSAIVKQVGKNSDFDGFARDKITDLAYEMDVDIDDHEVQRVLGTQDGGLDIVAWIPFRDRYANLQVIFGQCACGEKWGLKQNETRRFDCSYLKIKKVNAMHAMFVPRGLSRNGDVFEANEITNSLLFDRGRILQFIYDTNFYSGLNSKEIVSFFIQFQEDVV